MSGLFKSSFNRENSRSSVSKINWQPLIAVPQVEDLQNRSKQSPEKTFLIFKHSTRCGISSMALRRFEEEWEAIENIELFFLDLIQYRDVSQKIQNHFNVWHESPQAIVIKNGEVIYHASHSAISAQAISSLLAKTA